jgi:hypothetical protein
MNPNFSFFPVVGRPFAISIFMILVIKGLKSRLKWMDEFYRQKGVEHALDPMCDSLHFVVVGIYRWLYGWWTPSYSGTKMIVAIWTRKPHRKEKSKKNE